jgi:hypothetical protein
VVIPIGIGFLFFVLEDPFVRINRIQKHKISIHTRFGMKNDGLDQFCSISVTIESEKLKQSYHYLVLQSEQEVLFFGVRDLFLSSI